MPSILHAAKATGCLHQILESVPDDEFKLSAKDFDELEEMAADVIIEWPEEAA